MAFLVYFLRTKNLQVWKKKSLLILIQFILLLTTVLVIGFYGFDYLTLIYLLIALPSAFFTMVYRLTPKKDDFFYFDAVVESMEQ
jgi:hypothetical protein